MLRHVQHERKPANVFNATSVRPELVEGWEVFLSSLLDSLPSTESMTIEITSLSWFKAKVIDETSTGLHPWSSAKVDKIPAPFE